MWPALSRILSSPRAWCVVAAVLTVGLLMLTFAPFQAPTWVFFAALTPLAVAVFGALVTARLATDSGKPARTLAQMEVEAGIQRVIAAAPRIAHDLDAASVAGWFIQRDAARKESDVTLAKLQRLLYLAQGHYLASTGLRLFNEAIGTDDAGPVVGSIHIRYAGHGRRILCLDDGTTSAPTTVPDDAERFLSDIWDRYGHESAVALRELVCAQEPMLRARMAGGIVEESELALWVRERCPVSERVARPEVLLNPPRG